MTIYLIRHGQTAWNVQGLAQGHTDIPLDEVGLEQTHALVESFAERPLDAIWSSDLRRCAITAVMLAQKMRLGVRYLPALRERCFGEWEGEPYPLVRDRLEALAHDQHVPLAQVRPPEGESIEDVMSRLEPVVEEIRGFSGSLAVITHGGTCGLLLAALLGAPQETARSFRFGNTAVTTLERHPRGHFVLLRYAETSHLVQPSAPMVDVDSPVPR